MERPSPSRPSPPPGVSGRPNPLSSPLVSLAAAVALLAGMRLASFVVVPILLALFVAFVSAPWVFRMTRAGVPYLLSATLVLLTEAAVLVGILMLITNSFVQFREKLPAYRERLIELSADTVRWLTELGVNVPRDEAAQLVDPAALMSLIGSTVSNVTSVFGRAVLVILLIAFCLFDAARLWHHLDRRFGAAPDGQGMLSRTSAEVNRYLFVKTLTSASTGILAGIWCWVLDVDYAVLWGFLAYILNYIPTVGSIIAAIPAVGIALVVHGFPLAFLLAGGYLAINTAIGNVVEPRVMGQALGLSPVVVLLSMVVWGYVLGPVGAFLSVPLTMMVKSGLATSEHSWLADLMSNRDGRPGRPTIVPEAPRLTGPPTEAGPAAQGPP